LTKLRRLIFWDGGSTKDSSLTCNTKWLIPMESDSPRLGLTHSDKLTVWHGMIRVPASVAPDPWVVAQTEVGVVGSRRSDDDDSQKEP
jgi:hypothetical protein